MNEMKIVNEESKFRRRHTKEDKKSYRKRRKERLRQLTKKCTNVSKLENSKKDKTVPAKTVFLSRGMLMAQRALQMSSCKAPRITESYRSVLAKRKQRERLPSVPIPQVNRDIIEFNELNLLGEGTYGKVFKGIYNGNLPVAIKQYKSNDKYEVWREAEVITTVQSNGHCPNLPLIMGTCTKKKPYIMVTQFYGENDKSLTLAHGIKGKLVTCAEICDILIETFHAVITLHKKNWLHNDIKQNNVLLHKMKSTWKPVLIDFGKSRSLGNPKTYNLSADQKKLYRERHPWIAPELIDGTSAQSPSTDVYAFGKMIEWILHNVDDKCKNLEEMCKSCLKPKAERPTEDKLLKLFTHNHANDLALFKSSTKISI